MMTTSNDPDDKKPGSGQELEALSDLSSLSWMQKTLNRMANSEEFAIRDAFKFLHSPEFGFDAYRVNERGDASTVAYLNTSCGSGVVVTSPILEEVRVYLVKLENGSLPAYPLKPSANSELRWLDLLTVAELRSPRSTEAVEMLIEALGSRRRIFDEMAGLLRTQAVPELSGDFSIEPAVRDRVVGRKSSAEF